MKKYDIVILFLFVICINKINSFNDLSDCPEGKYGPNCSQVCECNSWSSSKNCSKLQGRCLDCKFGHFGIDCNQICDPRCKTNLCCALHSNEFKDTNLVISGNISILSIKINNNKIENISLNIVPDYNVGYPLALFNKTLQSIIPPFDKESKVTKNCYYTKYGNITGGLYENVSISINNQIKMDLPVILYNEDIKVDNDINGVIGLGFLNSINENLLKTKKISENIASYELNEKGDRISITFGSLFKDGKRYVHKLSYCNAISNQRSELSMKCKVDAIGTKKYSDALEIKDTYINFSLNEESSFVLKNIENYINYIESYYFKDSFLRKTNEDGSIYYCFEKDRINKLNNFGFVMNKYYYYYQANVFFSTDDQVNKDKCGDSNKYAKFMIEFTDKDEKIGIVFGKSFYSHTQFTIDNEERKIYLYTRNAEYFLGETKTKFDSTPGSSISPMTTSFIIVGIAFFLNVLSFLVYFLCKRKKQQKIE